MTIKLLNNTLSNIMRNKYCILCEKLIANIMEDAAVEICKVGILVKQNSILGSGYYNRKNKISYFMDDLSLISFSKKSWEKKTFE